jgi:hypothetical protein
MVVETLFERLVEPKEGLPGGGLEQSVFNVTGFYTWMFNAARTPLQRYTVPVKIDAEHDPGTIASNDICGQREQAARMLCRIDRASPKAVVFDKYYGTKDCSVNSAYPTATNDFRDALREASKDFPVIVGRVVSESTVSVQSTDRYYLVPSIEFGTGPAIGLINIDPDTRKLPLQLPIYLSE